MNEASWKLKIKSGTKCDSGSLLSGKEPPLIKAAWSFFLFFLPPPSCQHHDCSLLCHHPPETLLPACCVCRESTKIMCEPAAGNQTSMWAESRLLLVLVVDVLQSLEHQAVQQLHLKQTQMPSHDSITDWPRSCDLCVAHLLAVDAGGALDEQRSLCEVQPGFPTIEGDTHVIQLQTHRQMLLGGAQLHSIRLWLTEIPPGFTFVSLWITWSCQTSPLWMTWTINWPRAICLKCSCYLLITALSSSVCIRSTAELTAKTDTFSVLLLLFTKTPREPDWPCRWACSGARTTCLMQKDIAVSCQFVWRMKAIKVRASVV